ncbi:HAD family hydrolase [Phormidium yuhuli AB48]|uniref:HAD family hydrolase n=1 Tax=Phormidium yuhuli AB48 TaxID=2940671 RepID=A0ABY5AM75_9CYAN|nr:HAD-IIB family hydrolase [Phormidium yuhuli]USR90312.1 HAD family hydrolase [Phormidium yuhuli AB48]
MGVDERLVLATDLDGTFLGGTVEQRSRFYQYLQDHRQNVVLVFVTGRDLALVRQLYSEPGFPQPDYIIADVGTTVTCGQSFTPVAAVQDWIAQTWDNSNERVRSLLEGEPGLELQPITPQYRVSYYYSPNQLQSDTLTRITNAGFDYILSADRFLDVMPKGIAKGATLLKTLESLNLPREQTVVAGDTLNDRSLLETGLQGIVVGNAEPKLKDVARSLPNAYISPEPGAWGIWDGLKHHGRAF